MNMMFAYGNKIVTPMLNGSILPGITRDSVLKLAPQLGYEVEEARLNIHDIFEDARAGRLTDQTCRCRRTVMIDPSRPMPSPRTRPSGIR